MRVLSWVGGVLVVVAIAAGVVSAVRIHPQSTAALSESRTLASAAQHDPSEVPDPMLPRHVPKPRPDRPAAITAPAPVSARPAPAPPAFVVGSMQQQLINQDRGGAGLGALTWSSCLASVAQSNAQRMANQGYISHAGGANADLSCGLGHQAGENVGYWTGGVNDPQLNTMFMNSSTHRANIMGPYHYVATAWVTASNGTAYIAVEFG